MIRYSLKNCERHWRVANQEQQSSSIVPNKKLVQSLFFLCTSNWFYLPYEMLLHNISPAVRDYFVDVGRVIIIGVAWLGLTWRMPARCCHVAERMRGSEDVRRKSASCY